MLYTNLETLIFPIATGFVAAFESHFVYKGTYFVYKKYFLKMQALPAFVCDLDPFWIQVFILHLFWVSRFMRKIICRLRLNEVSRQ